MNTQAAGYPLCTVKCRHPSTDIMFISGIIIVSRIEPIIAARTTIIAGSINAIRFEAVFSACSEQRSLIFRHVLSNEPEIYAIFSVLPYIAGNIFAAHTASANDSPPQHTPAAV